MKNVAERAIVLALFIIFGLVKDRIGTAAYWSLVLLLVVIAIVSSRVRYSKFVKEHSKCPLCGDRTEKVKHNQNVDPKIEKVYIGKTRIINGDVTKGYTAISCTKCDWEIPYK